MEMGLGNNYTEERVMKILQAEMSDSNGDWDTWDFINSSCYASELFVGSMGRRSTLFSETEVRF
jgi:hypothetical protein